MKILDSISAKVGDTWPVMTRVIVLSAAFAAHWAVMRCLMKCTQAYFNLPRKDVNFDPALMICVVGQAFVMMALVPAGRPVYNVIQPYLERMGLVWRLQQDGLALRHSSARWRDDRRVVLVAVQHNGEALRFAGPELRNNEEIVLAAVTQTPLAFRHASETLRAGTELRNNEEIVLGAVTQTPLAFRHARPALRWNPAVSLEAVCRNRDVLPDTLPSFQGEFLAMSALCGQERKHNTSLTMNLAQLLFEKRSP